MKRSLLFVAGLFAFATHVNAQTDNKTLQLYKRISEKLSELKIISYQYRREENYPSDGYNNVTVGEMYIDFNKESDIAGFKFQFKNQKGISIFNNAELFNLNNKDKTISITRIKESSQLNGTPWLLNSYTTLRYAFPMLIADNSLKKLAGDTIIRNKSYHLLSFNLHDKMLNQYLGSPYEVAGISGWHNYQIIVDKATLLPTTLIEVSPAKMDLNRADYTYISTKPTIPNERSWYYSTYTNQYKLVMPGKPLELIKPGALAPDFKLTNYRTNTEEGLETYSGKILMINFWEKNCGHCIDQVSKLNGLEASYKGKAFKLLAVNSVDGKNNVDLFVAKQAPAYDILYGNKVDVAKMYGARLTPSVVILDKKGVVIYSGEFDIAKIKSVINSSI